MKATRYIITGAAKDEVKNDDEAVIVDANKEMIAEEVTIARRTEIVLTIMVIG